MKKFLGLALVMGIILSSCNMPSSGAPDPQVATAAALTVQAALNSSSNTQPPLPSPTSGSGVKITETPTYSKTNNQRGRCHKLPNRPGRKL